ncbi:MAG: hypothetical protein IJQ44_08410, partial [Bacteroidaceae bacterium]|nr:hypothetical protein [Bacteroidaceae bacterium]
LYQLSYDTMLVFRFAGAKVRQLFGLRKFFCKNIAQIIHFSPKTRKKVGICSQFQEKIVPLRPQNDITGVRDAL